MSSRRAFLAQSGGLVVAFGLPLDAFAQGAPPGSLRNEPMLDAWIRVGEDGRIALFTGKAELGQGIKTALIQLAAEELAVAPQRIELVTADTGRTPNEGYTAGSQSMQDSGMAIRHAAAQTRAKLIELAAARLSLPVDGLAAKDGFVQAGDGRRIPYQDLVAQQSLRMRAEPNTTLTPFSGHTVVGKSLPRVDIPAKLAGAAIYVQDLRLPGMVHARVVRPPSYGASLRTLDTAAIERMPGVLKVVRDGSYLAVVATREFQAISAMRALAKAAAWNERPTLPVQSELYADLQRRTAQERVISGSTRAAANGGNTGTTFEASYRRPYQMHGSIGPSCAVGLYEEKANFKENNLTVWTHGQGVYPLRSAIAALLRMPEQRVRCIHMEGAGCYGHNGADDAGADAALLARAFPGRPVRVQWMREDEHAWEPYGSAMVTNVKASLDERGRIVDWQYELWSNSHATRPGPAGALAPAWHLASPFAPPAPQPIPQPAGGGDRNAIPLYKFASTRVVDHFIPEMPLRVSALRALGAYMNVFSIESFMDELARAARADPVQFRLEHLDDPRARDVVRIAAERFGWQSYNRQKGRGRGFGFARYKNLAAYTAVACEVEVDRESGALRVLRVTAANDSGEAVNPDGIRNQIEGGILQSISWTLYESVSFDTTRITSRDWGGYPILRFPSVPEEIEVHLIDRPGEPFLGTGEAAQGPAAAALANALADATGIRIRELPFTRARVKSAIGV